MLRGIELTTTLARTTQVVAKKAYRRTRFHRSSLWSTYVAVARAER